jgi:hypothetical protein
MTSKPPSQDGEIDDRAFDAWTSERTVLRFARGTSNGVLVVVFRLFDEIGLQDLSGTRDVERVHLKNNAACREGKHWIESRGIVNGRRDSFASKSYSVEFGGHDVEIRTQDSATHCQTVHHLFRRQQG